MATRSNIAIKNMDGTITQASTAIGMVTLHTTERCSVGITTPPKRY